MAPYKPVWKNSPSTSFRRAMAIGTAGFTAALALHRLEHNGQRPGLGPMLVTGATGGVGSIAIDLLAGRGYDVTALTGKTGEAPHFGFVVRLHSNGPDQVQGPLLLGVGVVYKSNIGCGGEAPPGTRQRFSLIAPSSVSKVGKLWGALPSSRRRWRALRSPGTERCAGVTGARVCLACWSLSANSSGRRDALATKIGERCTSSLPG